MAIPAGLDAHHDGSEVYLSNPDPDLGETVTAFVRVPLDADVERVACRVVHDAQPFVHDAVVDRTTETERWWRVDIEAHNPVTSYRFNLTTGTGATSWLNGEGVQPWEVTDVADFRLSTEHDPPGWVRRTVWYQIFPDRFSRRADGELEAPLPDWAWSSEWADPVCETLPEAMTQVFGGSLDGITDRLDHLSTLGVTGLYTCPFFPAHSNHRYDASTFAHVDPLLGGDDSLRRLIGEAGRRGIRVMGDLTTNHTGDHHEWFTTAQADASSPSRRYYSFADDGSYESWLGVPSLPKLEHTSPELRAALYEGPDSVAGRFLGDEFGLAGWRIDVANMTARLRDVDLNRVCSTGLRQTMRDVRPDAWLLAEHYHDAAPDLDGGGWHGTMNYAGFARPAWTWLRRDDVEVEAFGEPGPIPLRTSEQVARSMRAYLASIPYSVALTNMNLLCSHDNARWAFAVGSPARHAVGAAMLMTWPGSPSVFAGDEIGAGANASWDVTARLPFPWHDPSSWNRELLDVYRELIALRTSSSALSVGGIRWVDVGADHLVYQRESRDQTLLVHLARADHEPVAIDVAALGVTGAAVVAGAPADVNGSVLQLVTSGPTWRIVELTR